MMGPLLHVVGDAANNLGVIIAALVIWLTHYKGRYYADPGVSIGIAIMLTLSSLPLRKLYSAFHLDNTDRVQCEDLVFCS